MKKILFKSLVFFTSCFLLTACEKELPEDAVWDPRYPETDEIFAQAKELYNQVDQILMTSNYLVEIYFDTEDNEGLQLFKDFNNKPEKLKSQYNIIRNKDGNIMYVCEIQFPDSCFCENIYESIFNPKGDLIMFTRLSRFTQDDVLIWESSKYYFNSDHDLVKKEYKMEYPGLEKAPEGFKCNFKYRLPYEKIKTRKKWLKAHGLEK